MRRREVCRRQEVRARSQGVDLFFPWLPWSAWIGAGALLALALGILARTVGAYHTSTGTLILLGLTATVAGGFAAWNLMVQIPATAALREYTGKDDVWVKCDSWLDFALAGGTTNTWGLVNHSPSSGGVRMVHLSGQVCSGLREFILSGRSSTSFEAVLGVGVLAHEAGHVLGMTDEAQTQCLAMQTSDLIAGYLGAGQAVADRMPELHYTLIYPLMPGQYRSQECRLDSTVSGT